MIIKSDYYSLNGYSLSAINPNNKNWNFQSKYYLPSNTNTKLIATGSHEGVWIRRDFGDIPIDKDGCAIISISQNDSFGSDKTNGVLYRISTSGEKGLIFEYERGLSSAVLLSDDSIIVSAMCEFGRDEKMIRLSNDGKIIWVLDLEGSIYSTPVLDQNENIIITTEACNDSILYSINKHGKINWTRHVDAGMTASNVVVSKYGDIYLLSNKLGLRIYDKNGSLQTTLNCGTYRGNAVRLLSDGFFFCNLNKKNVILNKAFESVFTYEPQNAIAMAPPSISGSGKKMVFNLNKGEVEVVDIFGESLFRKKTYDIPCCEPIITADDYIIEYGYKSLYPFDESWIQVFDMNGNERWLYTFEGSIIGISLTADNKMYILSNHRKNNKTARGRLHPTDWELRLLG